MSKEGTPATADQLISSFYEAVKAGDEKLCTDIYFQLCRCPDIDYETLMDIHVEWVIQTTDLSY